MKILNFIGACYVCFAVFAAMETLQSDNEAAKEPAMVQQSYRMLGDPSGLEWSREDITLEVWSMQNCPWCTKFEREIPRLEKLGYRIERHKSEEGPPPGISGYPTTLVTYTWKDKKETLTTIVGWKSWKDVDKIITLAMEDLPCGT